MYEFKEEFITGIESVDAEHRRLFEIADEAYVLSKEEFLVDKYDQVRQILGELKAYALEHFEELNKRVVSNAEKYIFHFLSPNGYEVFFNHLRDGSVLEGQEKFRCQLENMVEDNESVL